MQRLLVHVPGRLLARHGELLCSGSSCTYQDDCSLDTGSYWVSGWFSLTDGVTPSLALIRRFEAP